MPIFLANGISSQALIELEARGAFPAMIVDRVRGRINARADLFSLTADVIATGQVSGDSFR